VRERLGGVISQAQHEFGAPLRCGCRSRGAGRRCVPTRRGRTWAGPPG